MNTKGNKNANWKGGISKKEFTCINCGNIFTGHHSRQAKYCSLKCKAEYQKISLKGSNSPRWLGGIREKKCLGCEAIIKCERRKPYSSFLKQKYCSKKCADKNGIRYKGEENVLWKGGTKERDKTKQKSWSKQVLERDNFTCQECGIRGGDLHAHHIEDYISHEDKRWDINNGICLCVKCHYKTYKFYKNQYTELNEKKVNSGKVQNG